MSRTFVNIFTDGSCSGNPGPGGWSVVFDKCGGFKGDNTTHSLLILTGGEKYTTNNRMELMAIVQAVKATKSIFKDAVYTIKSDSAYCINIIKNGLLDYWATKTDFKTIRGNEVTNSDLWKELYLLIKNSKVYDDAMVSINPKDLPVKTKEFTFDKCKGHVVHNYTDNNHDMNPFADAAAREMTKIFKARS